MTAPRPEAWAIARCFIEPDDRIEAMAEAVESALIAAESAARADERERCAKVCEAMTKEIVCPEECAAAIRAMEGR